MTSFALSARAVGLSLGPHGRGVAHESASGSAELVHGGALIARFVTGESGSKTVAGRILSEALDQAQRELGDGTARVACIANALYQGAMKQVVAGMDPGVLSRAIRDVAERSVANLAATRCQMPAPERIAFTACGDVEVARALATVPTHLSQPGAIDVCEGLHPGVELVENEGFCFDVLADIVGLSREENGARIEVNRVHVLVVNEVLSDFETLVPVLEAFAHHDKSLVIVARGIVGAAAGTLVSNRAALRMHLLGLVPDQVGVHAANLLEDLCVATGATLIGEDTGLSLASVSPDMLGRAERAVIDHNRCLLSRPAGDSAAISARRIALLKEAEAQRYLALDRERTQKRAARLGGFWAELRVAGTTSAESHRRIEGARAAVSALQAASVEGVVPGGGMALSTLAAGLERTQRSTRWPDEVEDAARGALRDAYLSIRRQLASNAGVEPIAFEVDQSVVDPLSTTVSIIHRAVSVASTMLMIEVVLC
jgi:chaperonin GroEL